MNDNDLPSDLLNGLKDGTTLGTRREHTPRDLPDAQLVTLDHGGWLEDFSKMMGTGTAVQMTPFRQGVVTRLHWASKYVKLLERTIKQQEKEIRRLRDAAKLHPEKEKLDANTAADDR